MVKVHDSEDVANRAGPESCGAHREVCSEALTGDTGRQAIEPRNHRSKTPTPLGEAEGNTVHRVIARDAPVLRGRKTPGMPGSLLHRSWEISSMSAREVEATEKVNGRTTVAEVEEKSDACVVPMRPSNGNEKNSERVEGRRAAGGNDLRSTACRTQGRERASRGLQGVREKARKDKRTRFTALLHHITPTLLQESFYVLQRSAAVGVDQVTWHAYEQGLSTRLMQLHEAVHTGRYRAQPSRRVYIPKADGTQRALGIAALEDKIVQHAVSEVLSAVYEADFIGFSYGFRAGRSQHDALDALWMGLMNRPIHWVLDADISAFFDTIDHAWMRRFLEHRIGDERVLRLIDKWLRAGVWEAGKRIPAQRGTPQGAVISPLLANIYLHYVFDLWVHQWRARPWTVGQVIVVRYADDTIVGFQSEVEARRFLKALQERLESFGLQLHPQKTRLLAFGRRVATQRALRGEAKPESFDFLGFTHCMARDTRGRYQVRRLTMKKRMRASLSAIRERLMVRRHEPIPQVGRWLRSVIRGYFNYHAVPGNLRRLDGFRTEVCRAWRRALLRRSQRHRLSWVRFNRLTRRYVPSPRQVHPLPPSRFRVTTEGKSRMR
jgi:RNA-directed DNA polymerase